MSRRRAVVAAAAVVALVGAAFPQTSGEVVDVPGHARLITSPGPADVEVTLADHRALATRTVGRAAERESRLAVDVLRERLAVVADAARARAAVIQAARDAAIAARKAAEEAARRAAAEAAQRERERDAAERPEPDPPEADRPRTPAAGPDVVLPVTDYRITARFGECGSNWSNCHTGLDFAAPTGTTVRAIAAGRIVSAGWAGAYGRRIVVDHGDGTESWYAHLSAFGRTGGSVAAGESIGAVGATGNTTGPHLHLEVRIGGAPVDPGAWLRERGVSP